MNDFTPVGKLIYVDPDQYQRDVETAGFEQYLMQCGIRNVPAFVSGLEEIFQNGSARRSVFFMNISFRAYAAPGKGGQSRIPVYGVKGGISGITRACNYTELLTAPLEQLEDTGFIRRVFGTPYMAPEEGIQSGRSAALSVLCRNPERVSCRIPGGMQDAVSAIMTEIWTTLEKEPRTRVILRVPDAEHNSMDLLRALYLLMPTSLRLQTGFETNVRMSDLRLIDAYHGLPVYILTMEEGAKLKPSELSFPVREISVSDYEQLSPDRERFRLVKRCCMDMNAVSSELLDYSDAVWRREHDRQYGSFEFYGEVLRTKPDVKSLIRAAEDLETVRDKLDQSEKALSAERRAHEADAQQYMAQIRQLQAVQQKADRSRRALEEEVYRLQEENRVLSGKAGGLSGAQDGAPPLSRIPAAGSSSETGADDMEGHDRNGCTLSWDGEAGSGQPVPETPRRPGRFQHWEPGGRRTLLCILLVAVAVMLLLFLILHGSAGKHTAHGVSDASAGVSGSAETYGIPKEHTGTGN